MEQIKIQKQIKMFASDAKDNEIQFELQLHPNIIHPFKPKDQITFHGFLLCCPDSLKPVGK